MSPNTWLEDYIQKHENDPEFIQGRLDTHLGEELWRAMEAAGVAEAELAQRTGYTELYIKRLLAGTSHFTIEVLSRIAASLDMDVRISLAPRKKQAQYKQTPQKRWVAED